MPCFSDDNCNRYNHLSGKIVFIQDNTFTLLGILVVLESLSCFINVCVCELFSVFCSDDEGKGQNGYRRRGCIYILLAATDRFARKVISAYWPPRYKDNLIIK